MECVAAASASMDQLVAGSRMLARRQHGGSTSTATTTVEGEVEREAEEAPPTAAQQVKIDRNGVNAFIVIASLLLTLAIAMFANKPYKGDQRIRKKTNTTLSIQELDEVIKLAHAGAPSYNKDGTLKDIIGEKWTPQQTMLLEREVEQQEEVEDEGKVNPGRRKYAALFLSS
ncbi:UNVERIFIED_CONTAM: hypothetical protein HDU68_011160 [Siphonaria sp. JEL0065]|nr:hypothetical protein HDU68_011160 [Siphonaria sp. JEL0065]